MSSSSVLQNLPAFFSCLCSTLLLLLLSSRTTPFRRFHIHYLINLNNPDLLLGLWRGTIKVYPPDRVELWNWRVLVGNIWQAHEKTVALATPFIPSSFGRAPRNPAEKINSGYKAWEYQIYLIGLGPALF
jgi:hypothetical protein